jgi:mannitol-1-phosphate 5-dehydrogenase
VRAVHFGAGNIGRGFIGALLQDAGYHVTFADVNAAVVEQLSSLKTYRVIELGSGGKTKAYANFDAVNSATQGADLTEALSMADIITTSVGPNILVHVAPAISAGLAARTSAAPAVVMACENAINATDSLHQHILGAATKLGLVIDGKAEYANTAVDRIVPIQRQGFGLDVEVETFSEWVIDTSKLGAAAMAANVNFESLAAAGADIVANLTPFIERKLFTVNAGHATVAYIGQKFGAKTIFEALEIPNVLAALRGALGETAEVLIRKHGFDVPEQAKYVEKTVERFKNVAINDDLIRVGRAPLRKLSRNERLIAPAAALAEYGGNPRNLLAAIGAALEFESADDPDVATLQEKLHTLSAVEFATQVCGINADHPLAPALTAVIASHQS